MASAESLLASKRLEELLDDKDEFPQGVEGKVRNVMYYLKSIANLLNDSGRVKPEVRDLYMCIAEIAQDTHAIIDILIYNLEKYSTRWRSGGRMAPWFGEKLPSKVTHFQRFGEEIYSIDGRISVIWKQRNRYRYQNLAVAAKERSTSSVGVGPPGIREGEVVGLEGEVELLLKEAIFQTREELSILSIVGMGGIGKTTLASLLYNHPAVSTHFHLRAWVTISDLMKEEELLKELFLQLGVLIDLPRDLDRYLLKEKLHQLMRDRTCFIVFDDAWRGENPDFVIQYFLHQEHRSRLVFTSRCHWHVMRPFGMRRHEYFHEMKSLDGSKSWELFLKKLLPGDGKFPKHLEGIGKQIVRKCDGLPLAIQEAATKLAKKAQLESVWEEFLESLDLSETSASLELSYDRLSPTLRLCFLSLGFFKLGTIIRVDK